MDRMDQAVTDYFTEEGQRFGLTGISGSRRVILHDLPTCITLSTVLEAVAAVGNVENGIPGGIVSAQLFDNPGLGAQKHRRLCAVIEFTHPTTALAYVNNIKKSKVHFEMSADLQESAYYRVKAYLASSQSSPLRPDTVYMLLAEQTRSLIVPVCPPENVWQILHTLGTHLITEAKYDWDKKSLTLEFVSMFEADRAYGLMCSGHCPAFALCELAPPHFTTDSTQRGFSEIHGQNIHLTMGNLSASFNCEPFNNNVGPSACSWTPFCRPSLAHTICIRNEVHIYELLDWLETRRSFSQQNFKIAGSQMVITRKAYTWGVNPDLRLKLLLAHSLHDPRLSQVWDDYFRLSGLPNLRRYESYRIWSAGDTSSDQTESDQDSEDDCPDTSDTEACSGESSVGDMKSRQASESFAKTFTRGGLRCNENTIPDSEVLVASDNRHASLRSVLEVVQMPWDMPAPPATDLNDDMNGETLLLPDMEAVESTSWDAAEYDDWLLNMPPILSPASEGVDEEGHEDLISFDNDGL